MKIESELKNAWTPSVALNQKVFESAKCSPNSPQVKDTIASAQNDRPTHLVEAACLTCDTLKIGDAHIPLFDLDQIENAGGAARGEGIKRFGNGLRDVGFVAIKAEALKERIAAVNREMECYFSQPLQEKMKDWRPSSQSGFSQQGRETAANAKRADLKETFFIPPGFQEWPAHRKEFQEVMQLYHEELTQIAARVMGYVAEYLGEPTEEVTKSISSAGNLVRLAHYLAPSPTDDPEAVWCSEHRDLNALTLLPPSSIPGLQLLTKEGEWKAVIVPQGYLIVNTGEQLQLKTAGLIQATLHRVLNPGGIYARQARYSSIFFASWSPEFSLKPFQSCVDKMTAGMTDAAKAEYLRKFGDVMVRENLISRLIEMKTIKDPSRELVADLRQKGLLNQPPAELVERFPDLFEEQKLRESTDARAAGG